MPMKSLTADNPRSRNSTHLYPLVLSFATYAIPLSTMGSSSDRYAFCENPLSQIGILTHSAQGRPPHVVIVLQTVSIAIEGTNEALEVRAHKDSSSTSLMSTAL
jgi:hypothetical protein